jgi:environmental stress-induced protein Ves
MRILRASTYRRMPWKNGGGETTEIAVSPEGAGLDDFAWRISMARVDGDGPFSAFAGVDRTLSILEGEGLRLEIAGRPAVTIGGDTAPFAFPADEKTDSVLLGAAVTDLNVMSRRASLSANGLTEELGPLDTAILKDPAEIRLRADTAASFFLVEIAAAKPDVS